MDRWKRRINLRLAQSLSDTVIRKGLCAATLSVLLFIMPRCRRDWVVGEDIRKPGEGREAEQPDQAMVKWQGAARVEDQRGSGEHPEEIQQ